MKDWNDAYSAGVDIRAMADKANATRPKMLFRCVAAQSGPQLHTDVLPN